MPRVLIIFPGALGDLICLGPALGVLALRYPDCGLELMARAELADFAVGRMGAARGHSIDRREVSLLFSPAGDAAAQAAAFFGQFDAIHSFFAADDSRFRQRLAEACGGEVFFHPFRPESEGHIAAAYVRAVAASVPGPEEPDIASAAPLLKLNAADLRTAEALLLECGVRDRRFVLMMPGSGSRAKNWPVQNYVRLANGLRKSIAVVVALGPAEMELEREFAGFNPIKNPPLGALAAIARMAAAFVGNDSGVSHLAAAAGGCGVVIFGPSDPVRWRPLGAVAVIRGAALETLECSEVAAALAALPGRAVLID